MCVNVFVLAKGVCEHQPGGCTAGFLRGTCLKGSWMCHHPDLHVRQDSENSKHIGVSGNHLPCWEGTLCGPG